MSVPKNPTHSDVQWSELVWRKKEKEKERRTENGF
jgi:hypothetical protein